MRCRRRRPLASHITVPAVAASGRGPGGGAKRRFALLPVNGQSHAILARVGGAAEPPIWQTDDALRAAKIAAPAQFAFVAWLPIACCAQGSGHFIRRACLHGQHTLSLQPPAWLV